MRAPDTLCITCKSDPHADIIIGKINQRGAASRLVRLNTEDFLSNASVVFDGCETRICLKDSGRIFDSHSIRTVWYRRPGAIAAEYADDYVASYLRKQGRAFLSGFYAQTSSTARWINSLASLADARPKLQQLVSAQSVGLRIPKTLVTNRPDDVIAFIDQVDAVCTKSLEEQNVRTDEFVFPFLTQTLHKNVIRSNIGSVLLCPTLFQEFVDKRYDVRVIVMGNHLFGFEIHSQENSASRVDFRGASPAELTTCRHELPSEIVSKIFALVRKQGLVFAAIDLVRAQDGTYYFLENNANGQWLWLELATGVTMSDTFVSILLDEPIDADDAQSV